MKQPCITVQYHLDGEEIYHVDIAVYAHDSYSEDNLYLARGKPHSKPENKFWEPAAPKELLNLIRNHFDNPDDRGQFRRVIRYLKRWKDVKFSPDGNAAPIGIGLTIAAYRWLKPKFTWIDMFQNKRRYNDLLATRDLVDAMIQLFSLTLHDEEFVERLEAKLPVRPYNDLFEKMTNKQMKDLQESLVSLNSSLDDALDETDPMEACRQLQTQFGDDLQVPEIDETGQKRNRAIISSSTSA
jgi:hypothetical protein